MTKITRGSAFLLCAILGVALLIGAVCNFAYSPYSSEPVEAAETYARSSARGTPTNTSYRYVRLYVYVYYDNTYVSCAVTAPTVSSESSTYVNFEWAGSFTLTPGTGYSWRSTPSSLTLRAGTSSTSASDAYDRIGTTNYTFSRTSSSGNGYVYTYSSGFSNIYVNASTSTSNNYYYVFRITSTDLTSTSTFYYNIRSNINGSTASNSNGSANTSTNVYMNSSTDTGTITFTSKANGYFNAISIDGNNVPIAASQPSSYTTLTNVCEYQCWRYSNTQVRVVVRNLKKTFIINGTLHVISPNVTGGSDSTATVATTTANGYPQWVYTFDAKTNYYINTLNVGGTAVNDIPHTDPGDFTTNANCQFKCYRNNNQVIVIINALYNNTNIVGTYATLWSVTSNKASLTISEGETTMTREHYFSAFPVQIVATFTNDQNFFMYLDGIKTTFKGSYCTGSVAISNGTVNYSYSKEGNGLTISLENMTIGPHSVQLDYELGLEYNVSASIQSPGRGTVDVYMDDDGLYNILVTPATGSYVHAMIFNDVSVVIDYYKAEVYGVAAAETVTYVAKDSTNVFLLKFDKIYGDTTVIFSLINSKPTYRIPPSSSGGSVGVSGTLVTAGLGGEARMVGFDYSATDNESIHFVAVAYSGYKFAGWSVDGQILEDYSSIADIPYDLVKDKVVTAVFEPKDTDSSTNSSLNDPTHGADIL